MTITDEEKKARVIKKIRHYRTIPVVDHAEEFFCLVSAAAANGLPLEVILRELITTYTAVGKPTNTLEILTRPES